MDTKPSGKIAYLPRTDTKARERLREAFICTGWTQAELARRIGITQPSVNGMLSGKFDIPLDVLAYVETVANVVASIPIPARGTAHRKRAGTHLPQPRKPMRDYLKQIAGVSGQSEGSKSSGKRRADRDGS